MSLNRLSRKEVVNQICVRILQTKELIPKYSIYSTLYISVEFGNQKKKLKPLKNSSDWSWGTASFELDDINLENTSNMKFILHEKTLLSYVSVAKLNTDVPPQVLSGSEVIEGWYNFKSIKAGKNFTGSLQLQIKAVRMTKLVRGKLKYANGETNTSDLFDLIYQNDYPGVIQYLEMATAEDVNRREPRTGNTCLHVACLESKNLDSRILISLLEFDGIEVHVPNTDLNTPLHFFCAKWRSPELHALNLMLEKGAQVNFANSNKETPIFKAIFNECIRALLMKTLIDHGAQVNVLNFFGESVLHYAVRFGRSDLVSIILESSPELNIVGKDNLTPYELAVQYKDKNIANYLKTVSELFDWLDNHQLGAFKQTFLKNEIYLPVLPDLNADFLEKMGICADDQQKILAETAKLKNEITFTTSKADLTTDEEDSQYEDDSDYIERIEKMKQQMGVSAQQQYFNLNFDDAEIEYVKHLGTGVSGDVYKVFVNNRQMAVKVFKSMDMISEDEFQILLASRHPNIVGLYGVCTEPRFCLVMEYCSRGSLYHVLKGHTLQLEWNLIFKIFYEITSGLDALHSHEPQILHRDLKTLNLLVTDKWQVKVADFGLSRFNTAEALETLKQVRGTLCYCAPEGYFNMQYTDKSDIYSLGIVFWEVINRFFKNEYERPYSEYKHIQQELQLFALVANQNLRPTIPSNCPTSLSNIICSCFNKEPQERPDATGVLKMLAEAEKEYQSQKEHWDALVTKK